MKNSINIFTNYFPPENCAAANRMFNLSKALKNKDYDVSIITSMPNYPFGKVFSGYRNKIYKYEKIKDINIYRLYIFPSNSNNIFLRLISMFSFSLSLLFFIPKLFFLKSKYTLIQGHPLISTFITVFICRKILRRKVILNISDIWPLTGLELGFFEKKTFFYKTLKIIERFNYNNSDKIIVQSEESKEYLLLKYSRKSFLYRNLPNRSGQSLINKTKYIDNKCVKIFYAGLLGHAQGIYKICKNIDFDLLGIEFHIFGDGGELDKVKTISKNRKNIFIHGMLNQNDLFNQIIHYNIGLVSLSNKIYGAFPSKIYDLINLNIPILYIGEGGGEKFINEFDIGWTIKANDFNALNDILNKIKSIDKNDYIEIIERLKKLSNNQFNFNNQIDLFDKYIC